MSFSMEEMCQEVFKLMTPYTCVNLGIGLPTQVANHIPVESGIVIHSENGVLGVSARPYPQDVSPTLINAGKETIQISPGASFFDSAMSFSMIRGGHIETCVLGGMEVDTNGNLANWMIPGKKITGMGGAMDLVSGPKQVIVMMGHFTKKGETKLVLKCSLPLTGPNVVDKVVTEMGVFTPKGSYFEINKLAPKVKIKDLKINHLIRDSN